MSATTDGALVWEWDTGIAVMMFALILLSMVIVAALDEWFRR